MSDVTITVVDSAVTLTIVDNTVDLVVGYANAGIGIPAGGTTGTVLTKVNATNFNVAWSEVTHLHQYVRNSTGSTIAKGKVVRLSGAIGQTALISLARADSYATMDVIGVTAESIANNGFGYVVLYGIIEQVNTQGLTEGAELYLSSTVAGSYTSTAPVLPNWQVQVGYCLYANQNNGKILVAPNIESVKADYIVDSSLIGRQILTAADAAAVRALLGTGATVDVQTFASSGTWTKPSGAAIALIEMCGAGAGGAGGQTNAAGIGGGAGVYQEFVVAASALGSTENINIGAGGSGGSGAIAGTIGGDTQIGSSTLLYAAGGWYGSTLSRNPLGISGPSVTSMFGGPGSAGAAGLVGGKGPGSGGPGSSGSINGWDGGAARDNRFASGANSPLRGGGAAGGVAPAGNGSAGTIHSSGFGNGAGGGAGTLIAVGGNGGNGIRGSGGGGGGRCTTGASNGGSGGNGFVKITTISVA